MKFRFRLWRHFLPELDLFDSDDRRRRALDRASGYYVNTWAGNFRPLFIVGWAMLMVCIVTWEYLLPILYSKFPLREQNFVIGVAVETSPWVLFLFFPTWLIRKRIRRGLRQELVNDGVPICVKCGYDLRGSQKRCPECGTGFPK